LQGSGTIVLLPQFWWRWLLQGFEMAGFEDGGRVPGQVGIAASAVFRALGILCMPAAEPLPPGMAALLARLAAAAPMAGEQPQRTVESP
jgi:hypothetical protein